MVSMKKILITIFCLSVLMTMVSCGSENENDIGNTATQSAAPVSAAVNTAVPTAAPTEKPILKTVPWGEDGYTDLLPECTFGAVTQITSGDGLCLAVVEQIEEKETFDYIDLLIKQGFVCVDSAADLHTSGIKYTKAELSVNVVYASGIMTLMIEK